MFEFVEGGGVYRGCGGVEIWHPKDAYSLLSSQLPLVDIVVGLLNCIPIKFTDILIHIYAYLFILNSIRTVICV